MNRRKWQNLVNKMGWWGAYSTYLSSPGWKRKRDKRLKIDNNECRTCGSKENLEVHHKPQAYQKIPNEDVNNDLTTLCKDCHEVITNLIRQKRYQGRDIKIQNYSEVTKKELVSYGMEDSKIQVNRSKSPDYAQWRFGESAKSNSEAAKVDLWQAKEDGRRFRGIGPA